MKEMIGAQVAMEVIILVVRNHRDPRMGEDLPQLQRQRQRGRDMRRHMAEAIQDLHQQVVLPHPHHPLMVSASFVESPPTF
jgi:hypothetical protein